tara:strand:- start:22 stop:420 length:399 start_codon:yes stop_codon:yes gene_type:complete
MTSQRKENKPRDGEKAPETVPTRAFRQIAAARRYSKPPRFIQVEGPGAPREVALGPGPMVVGRSEHCDVQIISGHVSRQHAVIQMVVDNMECRDLLSRNGTWLNDLRVHSATLREGDIVQIGDAVFVFRSGR